MADTASNTATLCPTCGSTYPALERFCPKDGSALLASSGADLVGSMIADRYHVLKKLGEGGMGRVRHARR